jgi:uncharacterized protein (DUF58 family)
MLKSFYLSKITFIILGLSVMVFCFGLVLPIFLTIGKMLLLLLILVILVETYLLYQYQSPVAAIRKLPLKLSNGDENKIVLIFNNSVNRSFFATLLEELPEQLQIRDWEENIYLNKAEKTQFQYSIRPSIRGKYLFRNTYILLKNNPFSLVFRKIIFENHQEVACYPSFEQFNRIPIKALVSQYSDSSDRYIRRIGQSLEFEQIKEYAQGDDYRHLNWKASAKKGELMVNQYQDERSQDIYCVLDLGRNMQMPFNNLSLLDYSINACLALSKTILEMQDKAGYIGFSAKKCDFVAAKKDRKQFGIINDQLYYQQTAYLESDFEMLYKFVRLNIKHRSLLVIHSNFDSLNAMKRQLPYLKSLAKYHLVLLVFFENSEIKLLANQKSKDLKSIYTQTIAKDLVLKNRLISKELEKNGIQSLVTEPQNLSLELINKYLRIKKRQMI